MLLEKLCYIKTNINFRDPGTEPSQSVGSKTLFYLMSIMPKIFAEDSSTLKHPKNVKSINDNTSSYATMKEWKKICSEKHVLLEI